MAMYDHLIDLKATVYVTVDVEAEDGDVAISKAFSMLEEHMDILDPKAEIENMYPIGVRYP